MVSVSELWIASALDQLRANVATGNQRGNVEGLLARHILGDDSRIGLQWTVDCDSTWIQGIYDPANLGHVAALAYTIENRQGAWLPELEAGLQRAIARDPLVAGPGAALHDPAVLIGLCIGGRILSDRSLQYRTWCGSVIRSILGSGSGRRLDPVWAYGAQICSIPAANVAIDMTAPLIHRATLDWWFRRPDNRGSMNATQLLSIRKGIIEEALSQPLPQLPAHEAALLWISLRESVTDTAAAALQTPATIAYALRHFEASMKRWRWDRPQLQRPVRWPIRSEREVQDILWAMLRPICADLEDEDALPKFGHSTYRADFGIPSLGLLIEAKFARDASDFKTIEKEILEDLVPYLSTPQRYREILVFIYDDSCSVQSHDTTERALRGIAGIADVVIACRPSQVPPSSEQGSS